MGLLRRESQALIHDRSLVPQLRILAQGELAHVELGHNMALEVTSCDGRSRRVQGRGFPGVTVVADDGKPAISGDRLVAVLFEPQRLDGPDTPKGVVKLRRYNLRPANERGAAVGAAQTVVVIGQGKGRHTFPVTFSEADHLQGALSLGAMKGRRYWVFRDAVYSAVEDLKPEEVSALAMEGENKVKAQVARAMALAQQVEMIDHGGRQPIPDEVKIFVWQRDRGRCVKCNGNQDLEFDHIIPVSMGGGNSARNLQLLCEGCNRAKGGSLV